MHIWGRLSSGWTSVAFPHWTPVTGVDVLTRPLKHFFSVRDAGPACKCDARLIPSPWNIHGYGWACLVAAKSQA